MRISYLTFLHLYIMQRKEENSYINICKINIDDYL